MTPLGHDARCPVHARRMTEITWEGESTYLRLWRNDSLGPRALILRRSDGSRGLSPLGGKLIEPSLILHNYPAQPPSSVLYGRPKLCAILGTPESVPDNHEGKPQVCRSTVSSRAQCRGVAASAVERGGQSQGQCKKH